MLFRSMAEGALPLDEETSSMVAALARFNVADRKATPIQAPDRLVPPADADVTVAWPLLLGARERSLALIHATTR